MDEGQYGHSCRRYEANAYVYEKFRTQVESAGVEYLNVAVGERSGKVKLHLPKNLLGRERPLTRQTGSLRSNLYSEEHDVVEVDAVSLDDILLDAISERIVAWIDVEGACEQVLGGSRAVIRHALAIYIEVECTSIWDRQWVDTDVAHFPRARLHAGDTRSNETETSSTWDSSATRLRKSLG